MSLPRFSDQLASQVREKNSAVCVGLDPRLDSLPTCLQPAAKANDPRQIAAAFREFCCGVIDAVASLVPIVKPQAAFFEQIGPAGMIALGEVIQHARQAGLLVVLDGKRNDIGSTATAYAQAYLGGGSQSGWGSDALTVSPYLGEDSLMPFVEQCDATQAGIFVLVKTSNPGGGWLQDRTIDQTSNQTSDGSLCEAAERTTVYQHVGNLVEQLNEARRGDSGYGPIGAVVGATYPAQLTELRARMPSAWLLIPGFGAQGGAAEDVRTGFDSSGLGAIVNSSRHIIFAHRRPELAARFEDAAWQQAVEAATLEMNQQLNSVRGVAG
ncbi:orotidine-5'-phosphate decarboxylase [Planctomycetaceae bacterium SH139]